MFQIELATAVEYHVHTAEGILCFFLMAFYGRYGWLATRFLSTKVAVVSLIACIVGEVIILFYPELLPKHLACFFRGWMHIAKESGCIMDFDILMNGYISISNPLYSLILGIGCM